MTTRLYINRNIYFNTVVSQYFNVPFNNVGHQTNLIASTILNCSVVSWDIDTRKVLAELEDEEITLLGKGSGLWEIYADMKEQHQPESNYNEEDEDPQKEDGRNHARDLGEFIKSVNNFLFI